MYSNLDAFRLAHSSRAEIRLAKLILSREVINGLVTVEERVILSQQQVREQKRRKRFAQAAAEAEKKAVDEVKVEEAKAVAETDFKKKAEEEEKHARLRRQSWS